MRKKIKKAMVKIKALAAFSQISGNLAFNCSVSFPANFQWVIDTLSITNLDLIPSLGMACYLTYFDCAF